MFRWGIIVLLGASCHLPSQINVYAWRSKACGPSRDWTEVSISFQQPVMALMTSQGAGWLCVSMLIWSLGKKHNNTQMATPSTKGMGHRKQASTKQWGTNNKTQKKTKNSNQEQEWDHWVKMKDPAGTPVQESQIVLPTVAPRGNRERQWSPLRTNSVPVCEWRSAGRYVPQSLTTPPSSLPLC